MTQAVIRGKISSSGANLTDRLEDLLTSDVFGRLRCLKSAEVISREPSDINLLADEMRELW